MKFYHGTSEENWKKIQEEGKLHGIRVGVDENGNPGTIFKPSRCTYLAVDCKEAECYGNVILEVDYDPFLNNYKNNYVDGCWQIREYEPIPIENVKRIK